MAVAAPGISPCAEEGRLRCEQAERQPVFLFMSYVYRQVFEASEELGRWMSDSWDGCTPMCEGYVESCTEVHVKNVQEPNAIHLRSAEPWLTILLPVFIS